jgi:hypothetical protein
MIVMTKCLEAAKEDYGVENEAYCELIFENIKILIELENIVKA